MITNTQVNNIGIGILPRRTVQRLATGAGAGGSGQTLRAAVPTWVLKKEEEAVNGK